ncbi:hypothetical protein ACH4S9_01765 [Streptomyces sp. NPDC021225]|uniref:hypothetical protein n=1 Tax=Streptomyces sp. NPDC021225 TaxID=3365121 RepID=UPI0037A6A211
MVSGRPAQLPGGLHMRGALLERPGPSGVALALDNAVASTLAFSDGFTANGTVRLRGARISDDLTFAGAILNGPPDGHGPSLVALRMQGAGTGRAAMTTTPAACSWPNSAIGVARCPRSSGCGGTCWT